LQLVSVRGAYVVLPLFRSDVDYDNWKPLDTSVRVTNTDDGELKDITPSFCLAHSNIYDKDGKIRGPSKAIAPPTEFNKSDQAHHAKGTEDIFWTNKLVPKTHYYESLGSVANVQLTIPIGTVLRSRILQSIGISLEKERENWAFFNYFIQKKNRASFDEMKDDIDTFLKYKENTNAPVGKKYHVVHNITNLPGLFTTYAGTKEWAYSKRYKLPDTTGPSTKFGEEADDINFEDKKKLRDWIDMIEREFYLLKELFPDSDMFTKKVSFITKPGDALDEDIERWVEYSGIFTRLIGKITNKVYSLKANGSFGSYLRVVEKGPAELVKDNGIVIGVDPIPISPEHMKYIQALEMYGDKNSSINPLLMTYFFTPDVRDTSHRIDKLGVPMLWQWIFTKTNQVYIGESIIAIQPGNMKRRMALPFKKMGQSFDGANYKFRHEAYFGVDPGIPENYGSYDNVHIVKYHSGDTTVPTVLNETKTTKLLVPECMIFAVPLNFTKPKNFLDISGILPEAYLRTVPGWTRYNNWWNNALQAKSLEEVVFPYIGKTLPNNVATQLRTIPQNRLLDAEPHQIYTKNGWEDPAGGNGFWKEKLTGDFKMKRYYKKSIM
jgi:hypothetical protein